MGGLIAVGGSVVGTDRSGDEHPVALTVLRRSYHGLYDHIRKL